MRFFQDTKPPNVSAPFTGHHLPFIGFTYTHDRCVIIIDKIYVLQNVSMKYEFFLFSQISDCSNLIARLQAVPASSGDGQVDAVEMQLSADAYQRRITRLENEKSEMSRKLLGAI
jgi:hypothetical protein